MDKSLKESVKERQLRLALNPPVLTALELAMSKMNSLESAAKSALVYTASQLPMVNVLRASKAMALADAAFKDIPDWMFRDYTFHPNVSVVGRTLLAHSTHIDALALVMSKVDSIPQHIFDIEKIRASNIRPLLTNYDLSFFNAQDWVIDEEEKEELIVKPSLIKVEGDKVKTLITDIYKDNPLIYKIQPREFEQLIAELLRHSGYHVELTKQTRDGGYDILAVTTTCLGLPYRMLVECKRHRKDNPVDVQIIRSFQQIIARNGAHQGLIATTSYVTADARKERDVFTPYQLGFKEHMDIIEWIDQYVQKR